MGGTVLSSYRLPQTYHTHSEGIPAFIIQEASYGINALAKYLIEMEPELLSDQLLSYNIVTDCVFNQMGGIFILDTPAGTGKTCHQTTAYESSTKKKIL